MADSDAVSVEQAQKSGETSNYDPRLDFFSAHFDPLLALRTPGVKPPDINAPVYDNLAKYESVQKSQSSSSRRQEVAPIVSATATTATFERNWLPHQCKYFFVNLPHELFIFILSIHVQIANTYRCETGYVVYIYLLQAIYR